MQPAQEEFGMIIKRISDQEGVYKIVTKVSVLNSFDQVAIRFEIDLNKIEDNEELIKTQIALIKRQKMFFHTRWRCETG